VSSNVKNIEFSAGHITVTFDGGPPVQYDIADVLRSADIPVMTEAQQRANVTLLTTLANLFEILVKELQDREVIGEELYADYDLQYVLGTLTDDLGADIGD